MLIKTQGLVTKSVKYGESSLIFDVYTQSHGLTSMIVGGVRKINAKSPLSLYQLAHWIEVVVYLKDPKQLNRVKEARPLFHYRQIPFDLKKRSIALFITEVLQKSVREHEANPALYQFLRDIYTYLDRTDLPVSNMHLIFLIQLAQFLGFSPHGSYNDDHPFFNLLKGEFTDRQHPIYTMDRSASQMLSELLHHVPATCHHLRIDRSERQAMIQHLLAFYHLHIEKMGKINSHKILTGVL